MKIKLLVGVVIWVCVFQNGICQNPLVKQWDYRFGGTVYDELYSFLQTADGGYILGGYSGSDSSGDKTQNSWGGFDYWIVKTDSLGNKLWDKDFGGTDPDLLSSLQQTADGGYILGGASFSGISGNKTQASWGYHDYWIVKTDSLGTKQWDKDFGGTSYDRLFSLQQTADGGYILGGFSISDSSGDKTQNSRGYNDYWIVKTDWLGNKQWDKTFGGTANDWLYSLQQTADGGYILGGYSASDSSGDKTQNSWGDHDYWIVKTDSLGNKEWDKDFGGTGFEGLFSIQQTADGGYILGGHSASDSSGDKTQNSWGDYDYWIVKTDSLGNKQWDKDFGGTDKEELYNILLTGDGGYLFSGESYSSVSGDKTENNLGFEQAWIVKTNSLGVIQWDKTILTPGHDEVCLTIKTKDGCFAIANYTDGAIGGYKTQANWDTICNPICTTDYWIVKFCDSTLTTSISNLQLPTSDITIYPNPASDKITISFPASETNAVSVKIYSITGEVVFTEENKTREGVQNPIGGQAVINVTGFSNGLYFLSVQLGREVVSRKIVVQH